MSNMYLKTVELLRQYEPFSDCAIGQFEACDHLGYDADVVFPTMVCRADKSLIFE